METNMATTDQTDEAVPAAQAPGTHHSQFEMFWKEFRQNTLSLVGSAIILTKRSSDASNRTLSLAPELQHTRCMCISGPKSCILRRYAH